MLLGCCYRHAAHGARRRVGACARGPAAGRARCPMQVRRQVHGGRAQEKGRGGLLVRRRRAVQVPVPRPRKAVSPGAAPHCGRTLRRTAAQRVRGGDPGKDGGRLQQKPPVHVACRARPFAKAGLPARVSRQRGDARGGGDAPPLPCRGVLLRCRDSRRQAPTCRPEYMRRNRGRPAKG